MVVDAQRLARGLKLADAVLAEPVLPVGGEVGQVGDHDLPFLTQGAGDKGHVGAFGGITRHRGAGAAGLIVRVGVHEQQTAISHAAEAIRSLRQEASPGLLAWQYGCHE
ncbi:hypothetical protein GCM10022226_49820 [Sphaerisporangium flaviroseum]|uniref:Uncharacterized protein n=1 Tax=Sphaerisporangium flaviroseum TaxID=509199 RepID=A0ABP7INZ9_9ACTN